MAHFTSKERFPVKSTLASRETTIALLLFDNPVAHVQFVHASSPSSAPAASSILITGLEVQEEYCGQGYAKHLCEHVINMYYSECDLWVAASLHNFEAVGLDIRFGFKIKGIWYSTLAAYQQGQQSSKVCGVPLKC